jgi:hypothetical protein
MVTGAAGPAGLALQLCHEVVEAAADPAARPRSCLIITVMY